MTEYVRNLTFHSKDLGADATLVLTFDYQSMTGIYETYFPTAWKVSTFGATGPYALYSTYKSQLCFIKPEVSASDIIVAASTWVDINEGQKTDLTEDGTTYHFSTPVPGEPGESGDSGKIKTVKAYNRTSSVQGIGLGFDNNTIPPATTLYWDKTGAAYSVTAEFTPTLFAYISSDYQENQVLRGAIQSPAIWKQDLSSLGESTVFTLSYDSATGDYSITQDV